MRVYEDRPSKDHRGADLFSHLVPPKNLGMDANKTGVTVCWAIWLKCAKKSVVEYMKIAYQNWSVFCPVDAMDFEKLAAFAKIVLIGFHFEKSRTTSRGGECRNA
jgi:hypothetical protein